MKTKPELTSSARRMRGEPTKAEAIIWRAIRDRQLDGHKFRRQVPIAGFIADFACKEAKLVLEIDGGQHAEQVNSDARRTKALAEEGYRMVRFWNNEILENLDGVLAQILVELESTPSPRRSF